MTTAYPSQAHSLLNATGCGVAQRKAAVASKATGRVEWLGVEADVSESNLAKVKVGQPCEVQLDALSGMRFRGMVSGMVPTADRSKATVVVKVQFVDKGLWGSSFSRYEPLLWKRFKYAEVFRRIAVTIGEPLPGATATPEGLRERVLALRGGRP